MAFLSFFSQQNFDLLAVGIATAAIVIIAIAIFVSDKESVSNQTFFLFAISIVGYAIANYSAYRVTDETQVLWSLRFILFFATWASLLLYQFFLVFPFREAKFSWFYTRIIVPISACVAFLTLTPFVFSGIRVLPLEGRSPVGTPEFGLALFGITSALLVIGAIMLLIRKTSRAQNLERKQFQTVALGALITFGAILTFNVGLPLLFENTRYILLAPVFFFPFLGLTAYAILHYRLFNVKVALVSLLSFALSISVVIRVIMSQNQTDLIFGISQFVLVIFFSVWLIQSIRKEIDQREHIEALAKDLEEANVKLKELDRLKSQFLSIASHDLRAPLTIVRNFISLLLEGTYGKLSAAGEEGLRQVFDRATDMAKSVETYLNVSRIEQGRMKYDFIEIEMLPLVKNAVTAFAANAEKKGLKFGAAYDPALEGAKAKIDVAKMNEVLNNLLDNTIKYTPTGSIDVSVKRMGQVVRVSIKDTGVGMSKETIGKLFQLFSTADNSRKVNTTSTGVGLYISKAHVIAHGGKVWAESEGEGKGSTFILELPLL